MKKILLFFLTIPLLFGSCEKDNNNTNGVVSNTWTKTYGGVTDDRGFSVGLTNDGGYIITGMTTSYGSGDMDFWLIKTDANGDTATQAPLTFNISGTITDSNVTNKATGGQVFLLKDNNE